MTDYDQLRALFSEQQAHRARMRLTGPDERRAVLLHLRRSVEARREDLTAALAADLGKSRAEAELTELHQVISGLTHAAREVGRLMKPRRVPGPLTMPGLWAEVVPQPKGTVLILGPWNYPVTNLLSPCIDALAAGNTVILKPSEKAPATAQVISDLVAEAFEPRLLAAVQGDADVAEFLTRLPFDHILFTGNTEIGRRVLQAAAPNLTPVTLELGGKKRLQRLDGHLVAD